MLLGEGRPLGVVGCWLYALLDQQAASSARANKVARGHRRVKPCVPRALFEQHDLTAMVGRCRRPVALDRAKQADAEWIRRELQWSDATRTRRRNAIGRAHWISRETSIPPSFAHAGA